MAGREEGKLLPAKGDCRIDIRLVAVAVDRVDGEVRGELPEELWYVGVDLALARDDDRVQALRDGDGVELQVEIV